MWMTWNSRAERPRLLAHAALAALLAMAACHSPSAERAPDAPRPARDATVYPQSNVPASPVNQDRPVELRSVRVAAVRGDSLLERLAGTLRESRTAFAVDVITAEPLGNTAVDALPAILLNGERLGETRPLPPDRLILVLPDAQRLRAPVQVTVEWLGRGERTRTTRPLTITEEQLRPFR